MLSNLTGWHFIVILFVVLLLFGAPKLPALARSLGQSAKILKTELRPGDDEATPPAASAAPTSAPAASAAPASSAPAAPAAPAASAAPASSAPPA
jgi:sec-independent protein translocase protein TatA